MAAIPSAQIVAYSDKLVAFCLTGLGVSAGDYGMGIVGGSFGATKKAQDLEDLAMASADYDQVAYVGAAFRAMRNASDGRVAMAALAIESLQALNAVCGAAGASLEVGAMTDLDSFATYYNLTASPAWGCLLAPDFYDVYLNALSTGLTAHNTYFEALQGATYANGLSKFVVGTGLTAGMSIDSTKYAGGYGQLKLSSITSTAAAVVTVSGTFRKPDGTTATGNATATISAASSSPAALTAPFTDALLVSVSNITVGAGVTGGTLYVEAAKPAGRTNPPT